MKTPKTNKYKKCKVCYKMYPDDTDYFHRCDGYDLLVSKIRKNNLKRSKNMI